MPFHYVLADLLAKVPGAEAVVFIDDSGETVDMASTGLSPEELKVMAAYFGIGLRQARTLLAPTVLGEPQQISLRHENVYLHASSLPDGYFLVLLQSLPASTGIARRRLSVAVADLRRELFS